MAHHPLARSVEVLRRRTRAISAAAGLGWGLCIATATVILAAWADIALDLPGSLRAWTWALAACIALGVLGRVTWSALRATRPEKLARSLDAVARTPGEIHAGLDLLMHPVIAAPAGVAAGSATVTESLKDMAIRRATGLATVIPSAFVVPVMPAARAWFAVVAIFFWLGVFALIAPRMVSTELARFFDPSGDHPPYSWLAFNVTPANAKVAYGGSAQIDASVSGGTPDRVELLLYSDDLKTTEKLPMFPGESLGKWSASVTNVTTPGWYAVRSGKARSERFRLEVITTPKIEAALVKITPPAYTNKAPYEGAIPPTGIAGLPGTKVELTVKSNRPLAGGRVQITGEAAEKTAAVEPITLSARTAGEKEVSGAFVIMTAGKISAVVTDVEGQTSTDTVSASLQVLADAKPFVRILQPMAQSFATPSVSLPVEISAEDDYGISKLELYRGIGTAAPSAAALPVPKPAPTLLPAMATLPLSQYGVKPGDTIRLYAHVEDTDPAGPKGADSTVVVVTIISDQQLQELLLARESLETLQSKYDQANRRLEGINKEIDDLVKDLGGDDKPLTDDQKKKLDDLADRIAKDEQAVREASTEDLPFDLDKALKKDLTQVADAMKDAKEETKQPAGKPGMSTAGARNKLADMQKKLQGERKEFQEDATDPLQRLADVFPLLEDQAQFEQLYEQQRDLEQRLQALRDANGQDNPGLKGRMRDLEQEQRDNRQAMQKLTDDIESHAAKLPDDKQLDPLRKTANDFAKQARESTVVEEMASAESGLSQFSGLLGHAGAKRAADAMEAMMAQCKSMGSEGGQCLKFQPKLASGLGNTIQQMLAAEGLGAKPGNGMGQGAGGGYSTRRSSLHNVGLYGKTPRASQASKMGGGQADRGGATDGRGTGVPGNTDLVDAQGKQRASGGSDASVPAQYRQQVGGYFQRVADDMGGAK